MKKFSSRKQSPTGTSLLPLEKKLYLALKPFKKILDGQNVVVAVSGGIDSIVLLHALVQLVGRINYKIFVAHINHDVRAKEADTDEDFVVETAKALGVPVITKKFKVPRDKASENTLREKRYQILFDVKTQMGASVIITAHHKDDLIETRLMRLLQGTGVYGLKAMVPLSPEGVLRPLLGMGRRDVELYAKGLALRWRNDATNSDTTKFRNWIRRNWIARLRMDHPGYVETLFESLERLVQVAPKTSSGKASEGIEALVVILDRKALSKMPLQEEKAAAVWRFLKQNTSARVTSSHVKEFLKRLDTPRKSFGFRLAGQDWLVREDSVKAAGE